MKLQGRMAVRSRVELRRISDAWRATVHRGGARAEAAVAHGVRYSEAPTSPPSLRRRAFLKPTHFLKPTMER